MTDPKVVNINANKKPTNYLVEIDHYWNGEFGLRVHGVGDPPSPESRRTVALGLLEAIQLIDESVLDDYVKNYKSHANEQTPVE